MRRSAADGAAAADDEYSPLVTVARAGDRGDRGDDICPYFVLEPRGNDYFHYCDDEYGGLMLRPPQSTHALLQYYGIIPSCQLM